jgi:undecaprenyl-diphosphatase
VSHAGSPILSIDDTIVVWISAHRWHPLDPIFVHLGTIDRLGAVWIALTLALTLRERLGVRCAVVRAVVVFLACFAADSATFGIKDLVIRQRPFVAHPEIDPLYSVHSSSFPAGHAATAFAGAVIASYLWRRGAPLFALLALAIAFSRIYVGVHYPTDVAAGAAVGTAIGAAAAVVLRAIRRGSRRASPDANPPNRRRDRPRIQAP